MLTAKSLVRDTVGFESFDTILELSRIIWLKKKWSEKLFVKTKYCEFFFIAKKTESLNSIVNSTTITSNTNILLVYFVKHAAQQIRNFDASNILINFLNSRIHTCFVFKHISSPVQDPGFRPRNLGSCWQDSIICEIM